MSAQGPTPGAVPPSAVPGAVPPSAVPGAVPPSAVPGAVPPSAVPGAPRLRRWAVLGVVLAVLVGFGVVDRGVARPPEAPAPAVAASVAAPVGSQSSTWYCAGGSGTAGGMAQATLLVTNTGPDPVTGEVGVVNDAGATASSVLRVPARSEVTVSPSAVEQGTWLAATVRLGGGGVVVSQVGQGPAGWSQSACASTALPDWYFASGSTAQGSTLVLDLYNPMATPAVVDTTFVTARGPVQPQPDEGVVVEPGQLVAIDVGTYVQDEQHVSTIVSARSGQVVAEQLQTLSLNGQQGLSLRLGAAAPRTAWSLPRTVDPAGVATELSVLNPGTQAETVTVSVRLASAGAKFAARVAPFVVRVPPESTWHLRTDSASRIPPSTDFALSVRSTGGSGVVVDRTVTVPPAGASPRWGVTPAIGRAGAGRAGAYRWVLPAPGAAVAGAVPSALAVQNLTRSAVTVRVRALVGGQVKNLGSAGTFRLGPRAFAVIGQPVLAGVSGTDPLMVESNGSLAVVEELSPAGAPGVVAVAGVPLG